MAMNKYKYVGLVLFCFFTLHKSIAQDGQMKVIEVSELESIMNQSDSEKLLVINFWATWCRPCVKELPYFVNAQNQFTNVEFVYMSIDFSENASKAEKFANKKGLNPQALYLIDDLDYNSWIDKVSPQWSGAIPATLLIKGGKKYFYEKEFHEGELENLIKQKL